MGDEDDCGVACEGDEVVESVVVEVCGGEFGEVWDVGFDGLEEVEVGGLVVCIGRVGVEVDVAGGVGGGEGVVVELGE